jgi:hypothetical protein
MAASMQASMRMQESMGASINQAAQLNNFLEGNEEGSMEIIHPTILEKNSLEA